MPSIQKNTIFVFNMQKATGKAAFFLWWAMTGSNCRHSACKADALPAELIARMLVTCVRFELANPP